MNNSGIVWSMKSIFCVAIAVASLHVSGVYANQIPAEHKTASRYNAAGQLTGTISPDPDGSGALGYLATRYVYDEMFGQLIEKQNGEMPSWPDENVMPSEWDNLGFTPHTSTKYYYDEYGRKSKVGVVGSSGEMERLTEYTYDDRSRISCEIQRMNPDVYGSLLPHHPTCAASTEGRFGPDRITQYSYNAIDQIEQERQEYGSRRHIIHLKNTYTSAAISVNLLNNTVSAVYLGRKLETQTDANKNLTR